MANDIDAQVEHSNLMRYRVQIHQVEPAKHELPLKRIISKAGRCELSVNGTSLEG